MTDKKASKQSMYKWLDKMEETVDEIRVKVDELPEEDQGWHDEHFYEVAQIMVRVGAIARTSDDLFHGIVQILGAKMRADASQN